MASRIVFVPGFMQSGEAWTGFARLAAERYSSVLLEHRTHTADERIAEIEAADPDVLVGYSLGGRLALHAVVRGLRPQALVLIGCSAGIEDAAARARRRESDCELAAWMEKETIVEIVSFWERQPIFATQPPELVERQRPDRLAQRPADLASLLRSAGQGAMEPVWQRLPEIDVPVLALAGELDEPYVAAARRMADVMPAGEAQLIPGAGHAAHLERPRETAQVVRDFLSRFLRDRQAPRAARRPSR